MSAGEIMLEISLLILSLGFVVLLIFFIVVCLQVLKTAKSIEAMLAEISKTLPYTLKDIERITGNIRSITDVARREAEEIGQTIQKFLEMAEDMEIAVTKKMAKYFRTMSGLRKGMEAFVRTLLSG